jgi:lipopolysaccharide transport system ATP-binding protein
MSEIAIRVEKLGKLYKIGARQERYKTFRDSVTNGFKSTCRWFRHRKSEIGNRKSDTIWALKDVSFEVKRGEVVGIIGRNGAGKSTLLKILSRITEPTKGYAEIRGRVGALLEVGTGFHPELTGRENIYLNGAILGMKRAEIERKFDEIVAFAEVEKFIDTPVKHYSSGMYLRLAFAVAAYTNPDILLVDEVLAVGDAQFQKKCLGKMEDVSKEGRTVLFVSHDLTSITKLSHRAVLLDAGCVTAVGPSTTVIAQYLDSSSAGSLGTSDLSFRGDRSGSGDARFDRIEIFSRGEVADTVLFGADLSIRLGIRVMRDVGVPAVSIGIRTDQGVAVYELLNSNAGCTFRGTPGYHELIATISEVRLYPGTYTIDLYLGGSGNCRVDYLVNCFRFHVSQGPDSGVSRPLRQDSGLVYQAALWEHRPRACSELS